MNLSKSYLSFPLILLAASACALVVIFPSSQAASLSEVQDKLKKLEGKIEALRTQDKARGPLWNDAEVFHKGVVWALRYDKDLSQADLALLKKSIDRGMDRLNAIETDKVAWPSKKGRLVRGYCSKVDGSFQPYGLVIPNGYD